MEKLSLIFSLDNFDMKYNKVLLCYNLCRSLLASQFLSYFFLISALYAEIPALYAGIPTLYADIPDFYADTFLFDLHCAGNVHGRVPILSC